MKRNDTIAQILGDAVERALGDEMPERVLHPRGELDPHIDVYILKPTTTRRTWRLVTIGTSWPMAAAVTSRKSARRPLELSLDLPARMPVEALRTAATVLQGIAESTFRHGRGLGPGTLVPLREPILAETDLHAVMFGGFANDPLAARLEAELPTHPKLLCAAMLTRAERRAAQTAPPWLLWNAAIDADVARERCAPIWMRRDGRSEEHAWALAELSAASELAAKHPDDAAIAVREGLRLLGTCEDDETLVAAASSLLWVGRALAGQDIGRAAGCFEAAAELARRSHAARASAVLEVALEAARGDFSRLKRPQGNGLTIVTTRSQDERLAWLGLTRPAEPPHDAAEPAFDAGPPFDLVVDVDLPRPMLRSELHRVLTQAWFVRHRFPSLHGRVAGETRFTYVGTPAVDQAERTFDAARLVLRVFQPGSPTTPKWNIGEIEALIASIHAAAPDWSVRPQSDPKELVEGLPALAAVIEAHDRTIELVLASEEGFEGLRVWEALHAMGLRWGGGDVFSASGAAFRVATSTAPGYFVPESIVTGIRYEDLRFEFHLPSVSEPEGTLDAMIAAARDANERLGGALRTWNGKPLHEPALREAVRHLATQLREAGWRPGAAGTRVLFG